MSCPPDAGGTGATGGATGRATGKVGVDARAGRLVPLAVDAVEPSRRDPALAEVLPLAWGCVIVSNTRQTVPMSYQCTHAEGTAFATRRVVEHVVLE